MKKQLFSFFIFLFLGISMPLLRAQTISVPEQDSLFSVNIQKGSAQIKGFKLFATDSLLESVFLKVHLDSLPLVQSYVQQMVRIELEQERNGQMQRFEIARFFLPWKSDQTSVNSVFEFDISAYSLLLQKQSTLYIEVSNTPSPLKMTLDFSWKTGEQPALVSRIVNLWNSRLSGFPYQDKNKSINAFLKSKTIQVSAREKYAVLKIYLSGSGSEKQRPTETECSKFYFIKVNGQTVAKRAVWRDDCSLNATFPQAGPWTYSRANWCPGQTLRVFDHFIALGSDTTLKLELQIQEALKENPQLQRFVVSANLVLYEQALHTNDAAIVEILAPNKNQMHTRYNPICSSPVVRVKNTGSDTLRSLLIGYGLDENYENRYRWRGELAFMEEEIVYLPPLNWYFFDQQKKPSEFFAAILEVNHQADEYEGNNLQMSSINLAPVYPNKIQIRFKTDESAQDNSMEVVDDMGIPLFEAADFVNDSLYTFDLDLLPGCYEFIIYDQQGNGIGLTDKNAKQSGLEIIDATTQKELIRFEPDFGAEIRQQFMILK